ncbi:MAG: prepilin-type N-terminal cleavage/methylation domain-containing protein [Acidobacteriia bacterium]|nr:prepilin-type N-terminal cleavage/methylation domain-containing protein [Terriglobia bacterium]
MTRKPSRTRATGGFTLLEMIVASTIMAVAVVGLLSGIGGATRNASRLREYDRAVQLARSRMNDLLLDQRLPRDAVIDGFFDPAQTGGVEAGWRARLKIFELPPRVVPYELALERIELEVWWMAGTQRRSFTLDGYRQSVLRPEDIGRVAAPQ